jgi:hypothetical protein
MRLPWVMHLLADAYNLALKLDLAVPLYEQKQFGSNPVRIAAPLAQLGLNLLRQKKYREAERELQEALAIREKKEPGAWTTFGTKSMLGGALLGQKKYAEAEPLLLAGYEGMKQREAQIPPQGRPRLTEALERLVGLYEATGRMEQADVWRKRLGAAREAAKKPQP